MEVSKDGTAVFVGTAMGAFRVYDVRNRRSPRLIMQIRFNEEPMPIDFMQVSQDGEYLLVGSSKSRDVYIISARDTFNVKGYIRFDGNVQSACFLSKEGQLRVLAILQSCLLAGACVPTQDAENRRIPYPSKDVRIKYSKVDRGSNLVMAVQATGEIYVCGEDRLLKSYPYPSLNID